jgi:cytochrome c peroxidase
MKKIHFLFAAFIATLVLNFGCKTDLGNPTLGTKPNLPSNLLDYTVKIPTSPQNGGIKFENTGIAGNNFPNFIINEFGDTLHFAVDGFLNGGGFGINHQNPEVTNAGATLGRVLFYDPQLSLNNAVACASCHKQEIAFSDDAAGSKGFGGKVTPRNSMSIVNPALNNNLFWDSRSSSVADLVSKPIQNHIEMGMENMSDLVNKLQKVDYYPDLFLQAFGNSQITEPAITNALAQFVCSMSSADSKFDHGQTNNFANYSSLEKLGQQLFFSTKTNCSQCHAGANFAAPDFPGGGYSQPTVKGTANVGLDLVYTDQGKSDGQFRIPSLRNIALTAPYMHDGRFNSLMEVVEHYNSGIKLHNKLDVKLKDANGHPQRLNLDEIEKRALVAFLGTLTDEVLTKDEKFSNPFK